MGATSFVDWVKGKVGAGGKPEDEVLGTIVERSVAHGPGTNGDRSTPDTLTFRLDSRPDLEFRQTARALVPARERGDQVKVYCRIEGNGTATVRWVEKV